MWPKRANTSSMEVVAFAINEYGDSVLFYFNGLHLPFKEAKHCHHIPDDPALKYKHPRHPQVRNQTPVANLKYKEMNQTPTSNLSFVRISCKCGLSLVVPRFAAKKELEEYFKKKKGAWPSINPELVA